MAAISPGSGCTMVKEKVLTTDAGLTNTN